MRRRQENRQSRREFFWVCPELLQKNGRTRGHYRKFSAFFSSGKNQEVRQKTKKVTEILLTSDRTAFQICAKGPSGDHKAAAIASGGDHTALAHLADGFGVSTDDFRNLIDSVAAVLIEANGLW